MKRLVLILLFLFTVPLLAKDYKVLIKVEKTPADTSAAALALFQARVDSVRKALVAPDSLSGLAVESKLGQIIINNSSGTILGYVTSDTSKVPAVRLAVASAIKAKIVSVKNSEITTMVSP